MRNYGLSLNEYNALVNKQDGNCAVCLSNCERLYVDHDHQTEKVRGLLCQTCNTGLGMFQENVDTLLQAVKYLKEN